MRPASRDIVVTGLGAVSALADDAGGLWRAVLEGRGAIAPIRRFSTDPFRVHTGALVGSAAAPGAGGTSTLALCRRFALAAAREALAAAAAGAVRPDRIALAFGTGLGTGLDPLHELTEDIAAELGIGGPRLTVSTACSSSTGALAMARELLALDAADLVLAGGADVVSPEVFAGFHALGVLSPGACAPFSTPFGTTLGEGAGFLTLERAGHAADRSARVLAALEGCALSGDAYHETSPDPHGGGVERAIGSALADAGIGPCDVNYVNAHGSGTEANDPAEWRGIARALGAAAATVPISSTKGALGHAQGAAGALEAIVTIAAMQRDLIPPTLNFAAPRPLGPPDPVPGPRPRACTVRHALSLNAAFGGANAAVVLGRTPRERAPQPRRPVYLIGMACLGDLAVDLTPLAPRADPRDFDPASRMLTAAAALALRDGGIALTGDLRDRAGLLVGQLAASAASCRAFRDSIAARGLAQLSAVAFARVVLNAAAGACSKALGFRGPLSALTTGVGSGLAALVLACELLSTRADVALMAAAAVDEEPPEGGPGAACLLLTSDTALVRGAAVRVAGWGLAAPGAAGAAEERARTMAEAASGRGEPLAFDCPTVLAAHPPLVAAQAACRAVRDTGSRAMLSCAPRHGATAALLLAHG